jgi:hypothetical protein
MIMTSPKVKPRNWVAKHANQFNKATKQLSKKQKEKVSRNPKHRNGAFDD